MKISFSKVLFTVIFSLSISACGQKGPLIVERDDDAIQQDVIANTASADSEESEKEEEEEQE